MEVLSWILNIIIVLAVVFWNVYSLDNARKKGYSEGFKNGSESAKRDAYERASRNVDKLLSQIEDNENQIISLKSQLSKQTESVLEKITNPVISVNDLFFDLYRLNNKNLLEIAGIEEFSDIAYVSFKNKKGEIHNGLALVFEKQAWFVPFDKSLEKGIETNEKLLKLILSVSTENSLGERKKVTFNSPFSVHLTLPYS